MLSTNEISRQYSDIFTPDVRAHHSNFESLYHSAVERHREIRPILQATKKAVLLHPKWADYFFNLGRFALEKSRHSVSETITAVTDAVSQHKEHGLDFFDLAYLALETTTSPKEILFNLLRDINVNPKEQRRLIAIALRKLKDPGKPPVIRENEKKHGGKQKRPFLQSLRDYFRNRRRTL